MGLKLLFVLILPLFFHVDSWDISLVLEREALDAVGGEAFRVQPELSVWNKKKTNHYTNLEGKIVATLHHPTIVERLGIISNGICRTDESGVSLMLDRGTAKFLDLCINRSNEKYTIIFELFDEFGIRIGSTEQSNVNVHIGNPYQIGVIRAPKVVIGGKVWPVNPVVAVQDRGQNTIESINHGNISVSLAHPSNGGRLSFNGTCEEIAGIIDQLTNQRTMIWSNGTAQFEGLSIDVAQERYQLNFSTTIPLDGPSFCLSDPIHVQAGEPEGLVEVEGPHMSSVHGGKTFAHQPVLHLVDAGGNIAIKDNTSLVKISLYDNPSNASLFPSDKTIVKADAGIARFRNLFINAYGNRYRFIYEFFTLADDGSYIRMNTTTTGKYFNVSLGSAEALRFLRQPSDTWAGNQPFEVQPKIAIVDAGGNVIDSVLNVSVDAFVVESLSRTSNIRVDTRNDPTPTVKTVYFHESILTDNKTFYCSGHNITIVVTFTDEVILRTLPNRNSDELIRPSLLLNVLNSHGQTSIAFLSDNMQQNELLQQLMFTYYVDVDTDKSLVDIKDNLSLLPNDYAIQDIWGRDVSLILPDPSSNKTLLYSKQISLYNYGASIKSIEIISDGKEYGSGKVIDFEVTFTQEVAVVGHPELQLNISSMIAFIQIDELGTSFSKSYFYIWYKGERSESIPWDASSEQMKEAIERMPSTSGSVCVARSKIADSGQYKFGFQWAIRFESIYDDFREGFYVETPVLSYNHTSTVITTFIKDIVDVDDIEKDLSCSYRFATYKSGAGSKALIFRYNVLPGDSTRKLSLVHDPFQNSIARGSLIVNALKDDSTSSILANLTMDSNLVLPNYSIIIDTAPPKITNLQVITKRGLDEVQYAGDEIIIEVFFDKAVSVKGQAFISLNIRQGVGKATYMHHDADKVVFMYKVQRDQWSLNLLNNSKPTQIEIEDESYVRRLSDEPVTDANLTIPLSLLRLDSNPIKVDGRLPTVTKILIIDHGKNLTLHSGDLMPIQVSFTTPVVLLHGPPVLVVSLGGRFSEARYHSGNATSELTFMYKVRTGDFTFAPIYCHQICVAAGCLEGASMEGYVMQMSSRPVIHSRLNLPLKNEATYVALHHSYQIDTRSAPNPKVMSISIDETMQVVSFGDIVWLNLNFSDEVYVYGDTIPLIHLNIQSNATYERGNGTQVLIFRLVVAENDETERLDWMILPFQKTPILCDDQAIRPCQIRNANGSPADLSFVDRNNSTEIQQIQPMISINGTKPSISSMFSESKSCEFHKNGTTCLLTAGDFISIHFTFTIPVIVHGMPWIQLSLFDREGNHVNASYAKNLSSASTLVFTYEIEVGDYTKYDEEVSIISSNIQCKARNDCIRRKTSLSTLNANTEIPIQRHLASPSGRKISVDAISAPKVREVTVTNGTGVYSPGDKLIINVVFDYSVIVVGTPIIDLDVGNGVHGFAYFFDNNGGLPAPIISFELHIEKNYCTSIMEYIDKYSLVTVDSTINRASTNPKIPANTILPDPGEAGSISSHQQIILDCRVPYISNIWSSISPALVHCGETVPILVKFSRPVQVTGIPRLKLETGIIDRYAIYKMMVDSSTLLFEYSVRLGDVSESLDYWTQESVSRSSKSSFDLTNGIIMLPASKPLIHADVHLNPSGGYLVGNKKININEGEAEYIDLQIGKAGADYKVRFSLSVDDQRTFELSSSVSVTESSEFQIVLDTSERNYGDMFGYATSIHGDVIAIGAPRKRVASPEIQVLTVTSGTDSAHHAVQLFGTSLNITEGLKQVRSFRTFCDDNQFIEGSFDLRYVNDENYVYGTLTIPVDADANYLRNIITANLPILGEVHVSRNENADCNCSNAWEWIITFIECSSPVHLFVFDSSDLRGDSAGISAIEQTKNLSLIGGGFMLEHPITNKHTRLIPYNASNVFFHTALEEDIEIDVYHVKVNNEHGKNHPGMGRRWEVTFSHFGSIIGTDKNIPNLKVHYDNLTGSNSYVWSHTVYEGRSTLSGSFAMSMRGSQFSSFVPYNASELEIKDALESLDSINNVSVSDRIVLEDARGLSGYSWTITFLSVNVKTKYGWLPDPGAASSSGNLPPLSVESRLVGWNTVIHVESESGIGKNDTQAQWMRKTKGDDGVGRGMVGMYSYSLGTWKVENYLSASDGDSNDHFGHSLSVRDDVVAIGAPSKEVNGVAEKQILTCHGENMDGSFRISFRGGVSDLIPFNASISDIKHAMQGVYGTTRKIHSMPRFTIEPLGDWNESNIGFCSHDGNSLIVTLLTPDGGGISTVMKSSDGDMENMTVDSSHLTGGIIQVHVARNGTRTLSGKESLGIQAGAVYVFHRTKECSFCVYKWIEAVKLTSLDADEQPLGSDKFGWSVAIQGETLLVGSPGWNNQVGKVYAYTRHDNDWMYFETLTTSAWDINMERSMFGKSISFSGNTVIIGAPGYDNNRGCAVVLQKTKSGFLASQIILSPSVSSNQEFGHSVSLFKDSAVICSPSSTQRKGACYVFSRKSELHNFELMQKLIPSNVKIGDRFGWSVSMWDNRIVVGQVEDYTGHTKVTAPIQVIKTQYDCVSDKGAPGGNFKLKWTDKAIYTRQLPFSISAKGLKDTLEEDLMTGTVHVTRSEQSDSCGGFTWKVTFLSMERFRDPMLNVVPMMFCDATFLTGRNASCSVQMENTMAQHIRAKTHLFTLKNERWTEQAFMFPQKPQPQDLIGSSVSIYQNIAVVGAPNRNSLNINSGAAFIYDVSFSDAYFEKSAYIVKEGEVANITILRENTDRTLVLGYQSLDINSISEFQEYVRILYSFEYPENVRKTAIEHLTGHTAFARIKDEGRFNESLNWIHGLFDYRGHRDYDAVKNVHMLERNIASHQVQIITHSDSVVENPRETFSFQISLPGMFASPLGNLKVDVEIEDNEDGVIGDSTYYTKFVHNIENYSRGSSNTPVHLLQDQSLAIVGDPTFSCYSASFDSKYTHCGRALLLHRIENKWTLLHEITNPQKEPNSLFGTTVALSYRENEQEINIVVGCPGQTALYVFSLHLSNHFVEFKDRLEPFGEFKLTPEHDFATMNTVSLNRHVICVSAPQLEIVFVYRWSDGDWNPWLTLRARDYDYDVYDMNYTVHHVHKQRFGHAIKADARFLVVSAPYAEYGNRGSILLRERYNTDGLDNVGLGMGKVYVFHSRPHITNISWSFQEMPCDGSFKLRYSTKMLETRAVSIHFDSTELQNELRALGLVVSIEKTVYARENMHFISMKITFVECFSDDAPNLQVLWSKASCPECDTFLNANGNEMNGTLSIIKESIMTPYQQTSELQSSDIMSGDGFGFSIDIHENHILVGAPFSSAKTRSTWNFETGDLTGWVSSGTAFDHQPTYGDNSVKRTVYSGIGKPSSRTSGDPQSAGIQGHYYIATYERRRRPYDSEGGIQGDIPIGTLTSDPFMIQDGYISFLIGGGCNHLTVYIELLVDGFPVMRSTGSCNERMERMEWNVSAHKNRSAQIRIVDYDKGHWGHINIDDIQFSWINGMNAADYVSAGVSSEAFTYTKRKSSIAAEQTPRSGAAYVFRHQCFQSECTWKEIQRLVPSDKRKGNLFGSSVAINEKLGIILVGSPTAPAHGVYKQEQSPYPFNDDIFTFPVDSRLENFMTDSRTQAPNGGSLRLVDHIRQDVVNKLTLLPESYGDNAGAVYMFNRREDKTEWISSEDAKFAPPNLNGGERFGGSISLSGSSALFGTDSESTDTFLFDLKWYGIRFKRKEFIAREGTDEVINIEVVRNKGFHDREVSIGYSTSDLTALGISNDHFDKCLSLSLSNRTGCGDYEHVFGVLTFQSNQSSASFQIRIMNDGWRERNMKYVQLSMHIPGGSVIHGEDFRAQLRIDDDDFTASVQM